MTDVLRDRHDEEERYRRGRSLPQEIIRKVQLHLDADGDFVTLFENFQKRYALCVVIKNNLRMGWKECQAINDIMKIASRGTQIDNDSFIRLVEQLKTKYGKVQDPNIQNGRLTAVIFPGQGTIRTEKMHTIVYSSISFDKDGDLIFSAHTNESKVYRVCLELTLQDNRLLNLDCKAFIDILTMLETGDRLSPQQFFACGAVLRRKYNFVTPSTSNSGHTRCMTVLASRITNTKPIPDVFNHALQDVQDYHQDSSSHPIVDDPSSSASPSSSSLSHNPPHHHNNNHNHNNHHNQHNNPHNNNHAAIHGAHQPPPPPLHQHPHYSNGATPTPENNLSPIGTNGPRSPYPGIVYTAAIKEGGQGQVYAGLRTRERDPTKREIVAVKVFLDQEGATEAYKTELRNLLKMSLHPNVVEVLDFFETPAPALVMRLIDGVDLMDYLRSNGAQTEENGRRLAVGIAEGLTHLHRHGIIHRDFKSANILRQHDGTPVIIDLGLGSVVDYARKNIKKKRHPPAMPPHQHQHQHQHAQHYNQNQAQVHPMSPGTQQPHLNNYIPHGGSQNQSFDHGPSSLSVQSPPATMNTNTMTCTGTGTGTGTGTTTTAAGTTGGGGGGSEHDHFSSSQGGIENEANGHLGESIRSHIIHRTSTIRGSFPWMAPEMITAQEWSEKTDVYAFGIIMWEIFSGQTPFVQPGEDVNPVQLLIRIANGERPDIEAVGHVSRELRNLMEACWHGEPRRRPSMNRVMDLLHGNDPELLFDKFDSNGSGGLDFQEFVTFLHKYVPKRVEMDMMAPLFRAIDTDNSGEIGLDEFQKFWWQVEKTGLRNVVENSRTKNI